MLALGSRFPRAIALLGVAETIAPVHRLLQFCSLGCVAPCTRRGQMPPGRLRLLVPTDESRPADHTLSPSKRDEAGSQ